MRSRYLQVFVAAWVSAVARPTSGTLVVDRQPHPYGGSSSDTELYDNSGQPSWQRSADEVVLSGPAALNRITAWGFYHLDNPPATETLRLTFYRARGDGLPDESNVHWQQFVENPMRTETGRIIAEGYLPREFLFEFDFASPISLDGGTLYWLEIAQIGDIETRFRWEDSVTIRDGFAFRNPATGDWRHTINSPNTLAFQLHAIPEPSTALVMVCSLCIALARRAPRRMPGVTRQRKIRQHAAQLLRLTVT